MSVATATQTGLLSTIMTNLVALEERVHADLRVYRWRPRTPDLPCLWNWMPDAPFEQRDTARFRDNFNVSVFVGIRHTDADEETARMEEYADAFRTVIDPALHANTPLGAKWAIRQRMRTVEVDFAGTPVLAVEFPILIQVERMIFPS